MRCSKAIGLISGGLDSALAVKIMQEQDIEVIGLHVVTCFMPASGQNLSRVNNLAKSLSLKLKVITADSEYLDIVRNPAFGYGKNLNPCVDCHIFMLRQAKKLMLEEEASFVFTGEVLGQRPFSQTQATLRLIERESGLEGYVVRPLSALLLPVTKPEQYGWLERNQLLGIQGRGRKIQLALAEEKKLQHFTSPAGGCLLTVPSFCRRLADLMKHREKFTTQDCLLLQIGRHFRLGENCKLIIPRNQDEAVKLRELKQEEDILIQEEGLSHPSGLVQGKMEKLALEIVAAYSQGGCSPSRLRVNDEFFLIGRKPKESFRTWLLQ